MSADSRFRQQFFHGTRADLHHGDLIAPGFRSNYGEGRVLSWVYCTGTLDAAIWGAELAAGSGPERIYVVEPTGPIVDDPQPDGQEVSRQSDTVVSLPRSASCGRRGHEVAGTFARPASADERGPSTSEGRGRRDH